MSDIVERLRDTHPNFDEKPMCEEAAAEIERLRAEIARKDAALTAIAEYDTDAEGNWGFFRDEADAALNPKEPTHD